jgi:UDP-N-acetylmuramoyl-tripeptide--D-alanyl-D-alanine ligase
MVTVKKKLLSVKDIVHAAAGTLEGNISSEDAVSSVCIDSRTCGADALFVPLKGEHTDGHRYIPEAADKGALCAYSSIEYWKAHREALQQISARQKFGCICVADPLTAMQQAAKLYLDRLTAVRRVGITGSSGKTTTKELIGAVLSEGRSTRNPGSNRP